MVATSTRKDLKYGRVAAKELSVSNFLPYARHVDEHTVSTKDGLLFQCLKVDGFSFETADQADINVLKRMRETMLRSISDSRFAIYHHIIRREVNQYPDGVFSDPFCAALDKKYQQSLSDKRMFVNEQYVTLVRRPTQGAIGGLSNFWRNFSTKLDKQAEYDQLQADLQALNDGVKKLQTTLGAYGAHRLKTYVPENGLNSVHSEILSFLSLLLNMENRPVEVVDAPLDEYLPAKRIVFGKSTFQIQGNAKSDKRIGAMMSIKNYDTATGPGILDNMLRLPHEFVLTQSFGFIDREVAKSQMKLVQRQFKSTEEGAVSLEASLTEAIDEVTSGKAAFGLHHLTLAAYAKSADELDNVVSDIDNALNTFGIIAVREDLNLEPAFWAQMPANFAYIARPAKISTKNFAGFAALHTFPSGKLHGNHWGESISLLETTSGSPYWFSFHDKRDVGNFTLIGPTGTGKTVLMSFLAAQAQRVGPRTIYFDKDYGAEIFLRGIGGDYTIITQGQPTGLNPLQLPDTSENRAFLRAWIGHLVTNDTDTKLSPTDLEMIDDAVKASYELPYHQRRLRIVADLFEGFEDISDTSLSSRLRRWHSGGEKAWLFDNPTDTLSLDNRTIGFDITSILDDRFARSPWLEYIFHRISTLLEAELPTDDNDEADELLAEAKSRRQAKERKQDSRTMILLDEGWKLLDDPAFSHAIKDWLKTIRKKNGLVGFATQSVSDILTSAIGDTIVEQSPTNIFLPNPRADEKTYCGAFGLSKRELKIIRELTPESRYFLLRHERDSVIARLNLNGMDEYIAVLSGRTETVTEMRELRQRLGEDPAVWLPKFMERHVKN